MCVRAQIRTCVYQCCFGTAIHFSFCSSFSTNLNLMCVCACMCACVCCMCTVMIGNLQNVSQSLMHSNYISKILACVCKNNLCNLTCFLAGKTCVSLQAVAPSHFSYKTLGSSGWLSVAVSFLLTGYHHDTCRSSLPADTHNYRYGTDFSERIVR